MKRTGLHREVQVLAAACPLVLLCCGGSAPPAARSPGQPAPESATAASFSPEGPDDSQEQSDDEGVALSGETGTLDANDVNNVFQEHWSAISRCYTSVIGGRYYVGGTMTVKVKVGHDGTVAAVAVPDSDLGSYQAERCVISVVQGLRFPQPQGGPTAELTYPVQFPERAAIVTWDAARVASAVRKQRGSLARCTGEAPAGLTATLYVGPGGTVQSAGLAASSPIADGYAQCVVGALTSWTMPDPRSGIAKVQLPLD